VTNLITPRALFSPTYILNLVKPELAPCDPLTPKTPSSNQTRSKSDDSPRRNRHLNFSRWRPSWFFGETGNSAIRSVDLENPTVEPNMKWIERSLAEIWPFEIFQMWGRWSVVGRRSSVAGRSVVNIIKYRPTSSYTDLINSSSLR